MYLRRCYRRKNGKRHAYWALVESVRTARGPRQRIVAYLGELEDGGRRGIQEAAKGFGGHQSNWLDPVEPEWVEVGAAHFRVERVLEFGRPWLGMELIRRLGLMEFLDGVLPRGREDVPWSLAAMALVLLRWYDPSSELRMAEHLYEQSALVDLLLYDVTSTYFEGLALGNRQARHGYSRDHRGDCKQVCIALVVTGDGLPLGYEVFEGNRHDSKTVQEMVTTMEARDGRADRIWVMDRGMISPENLEFLQTGNRRYILGTPRASLKHFERELLAGDWTVIREGLEVKRCESPTADEVFILCRSRDAKPKKRRCTNASRCGSRRD